VIVVSLPLQMLLYAIAMDKSQSLNSLIPN
jgi:hypothetical protein